MKLARKNERFFQEKQIPAQTVIAGMAALVHALDIQAPLRKPVCVSERYVKESKRHEKHWTVFDKRYLPEDTVEAQLSFALRHEDIDLLALKRILTAIPEKILAKYVLSAPTGIPNRRAWFFYEFLTGKTLPIEDAPKVAVVDALDAKQYFTRSGEISRRHKVRNNLLGNKDFCPIIRRTEKLEAYVKQNMAAQAQQAVGRVNARVIARAASFLLLADSRASFEIEGERPPRNRLERWGRAVQQAGKNQLSLEEIERLHEVLIEDSRFTKAGLRKEGVFLGERSADGEPLPEFIGARQDDLKALLEGMIESNVLMSQSELDAVLQAAATAFGFVYIHPFEDGNGRLHRCLIHHVLAEKNYTPPGLVFPVSSVMFDWIDEYRKTLQAHSAPLMTFIDWVPTAKGNVEVHNDTADLYRYFDCTEAAEFLYKCVQRTIEVDLPQEIDYLRRHDEAKTGVMNLVEMPDRTAEDFIMFMRQNNWKLPKGRRESEFAKLSDDEAKELELVVQKAFKGFSER